MPSYAHRSPNGGAVESTNAKKGYDKGFSEGHDAGVDEAQRPLPADLPSNVPGDSRYTNDPDFNDTGGANSRYVEDKDFNSGKAKRDHNVDVNGPDGQQDGDYTDGQTADGTNAYEDAGNKSVFNEDSNDGFANSKSFKP